MARNMREVLPASITGTRRLKAGVTYVVTSDVRIRPGAKLVVEDGVNILILNGLVPESPISHAALIFEQGSALEAERLFIRACNDRHRPVKMADNGGVWFFGAYRSAAKDGLNVTAADQDAASFFSASLIAAYYLGHSDPTRSCDDPMLDDRDGFSVMGVGPQEWRVTEVRSFHSGDDGIDLTNSQIRVQRLRVVAPTEDGLNLSSSKLEVTRSLLVDVSVTAVTDRDIVDLEVDDGPSYVELARHCHVDIQGVFGDDLHLLSPDMPAPNHAEDVPYRFKGFLRQSPALVYSLNED